MTLFDGIGGLSQTRDLFTAPGSLLGYDPYFQDAQRFQQGGPVTYASLQDLDPYGANRTAAKRGRSIDIPYTSTIDQEEFPATYSIDPRAPMLTGLTTAIGGPLGLGLGALGALYGAYQKVSDAEKMRAGMLPPEAYKPLGFWDTIATAWPEWLGGRSYEEAITDKDLATMSKYGMGLAAGPGGALVGRRGGYNLTGPRISTGMTNQEYEEMLDRDRQFDMQGWMGNLAVQIAERPAREFYAQRTDPLKGADIRTETLPPALVRAPPPSTVTVENLPPPDRWAGYQAARHGIAEAVDRAAAQKAAEEFAALGAWGYDPTDDPGGYGAEGADTSGTEGFGSMDDYGGGLGY